MAQGGDFFEEYRDRGVKGEGPAEVRSKFRGGEGLKEPRAFPNSGVIMRLIRGNKKVRTNEAKRAKERTNPKETQLPHLRREGISRVRIVPVRAIVTSTDDGVIFEEGFQPRVLIQDSPYKP